MAQFRNIEIDSEVHQLIENERRGCNESPNDALRRLLKIGEPKFAPERDAPASVPTKRSWSDKGVVLPHGTAIRMEYKGISSMASGLLGIRNLTRHRAPRANYSSAYDAIGRLPYFVSAQHTKGVFAL